jgi:GNAT superfamily N-acetyltransferase
MTDQTHSQGITSRSFRFEPDFARVRGLLIETYPITPPGFNWEIRRWEGNFHDAPAGQNDRVRLWEAPSGQLVGAAFSEGPGDVTIQVHPGFRFLEEEMLAWGEENLAAPQPNGERRLGTTVFEYDAPRQRLLQKRGYHKTANWGVIWRMRLGQNPLPEVRLADGYTLRTTRPGDEGEYQRMADMINAGFNRTAHTAEQYKLMVEKMPCFRHDLNLVAETADGSFAAHAGMTFEADNRYGVFEPVCTHPQHRRKGLASRLMAEGLQRLKALGALDVYVGTGDMVPANELYASMGFTEVYRCYDWEKLF